MTRVSEVPFLLTSIFVLGCSLMPASVDGEQFASGGGPPSGPMDEGAADASTSGGSTMTGAGASGSGGGSTSTSDGDDDTTTGPGDDGSSTVSGESSGDGATTSGTSSTGAPETSGQDPSGVYGRCDTCGSLTCVDFDSGQSFCSETGCNSDPSICPEGASGDASPLCLSLGNGQWACALDCQGGQICPDGMSCEEVFDVCVWD